MGKIPRSEASVDFKPAMQPFSTGDGYEAPGRGLQKIGQGIASLGQGLTSALGDWQQKADREDEHNAKLELLKFSGGNDIAEQNARASFNPDTGDIEAYGANRIAEFESGAAGVYAGVRSERAKRIVELQIERMRQATRYGVQQFQTGVRQQRLFTGTERAITGQFDKLDKFKPVEPSADAENQAGGQYGVAGQPGATPPEDEQYIAQFKAISAGAASIIESMPGTPQQKQALTKHARDLAMAALGGKKKAWPIVEKFLNEQIEQGYQPTQPGQGAGGVSSARSGTPVDYLRSKLAPGAEGRVSDVTNLHPVKQDRLAAFVAAAEDAGHDIRILSGHRDASRQAVLWQQALQKYGSADEARKHVAPPGGSTHQSGEAVDLVYMDRGRGLGGKRTAAVEWAHANASKFGMTFPLGHEDWHLEPVEARAGGKRYGGSYAQGAPMWKPVAQPAATGAQPASVAGGSSTILQADKDGRIDPVAFASRTAGKIAESRLNGMVPDWGPKFGITTGAPQEWARFFTMLQQQESGHRIAQKNPDGSLRRFPTTPPTEQSFGPGQFKPGEYGLKNWDDVNNPDKVIDAYINVATRGKLFAYFGSLQRPHEWGQHAGWYDKTVASKMGGGGGAPANGGNSVAAGQAADILTKQPDINKLSPDDRAKVYKGLFAAGILNDLVDRSGPDPRTKEPALAAILKKDPKDRTPDESNRLSAANPMVTNALDTGQGRAMMQAGTEGLDSALREKVLRGDKLTDGEHNKIRDAMRKNGILSDGVNRGADTVSMLREAARSAEGQPSGPAPVSQRGLVQYAGLGGGGAQPANDAGQAGGTDRPANTIPGQQVAQAPQTAWQRSQLRSELIESLLKAKPAMMEAHRREVDGMVSQIEEMASKGYQVDDAVIARTRQEVARTRDPAMVQRMDMMATIVREARATNTASPVELTAVVQGLEAQALKGPTTPQQVAAIEHFKKKRQEIEKALASNPYEHGNRVGLLPAPVPELKPGMPPDALAATLEARVAARAVMEDRMQTQIPLLQGREQQELIEYMKKSGAPPEARIAVVRTMYDVLGKRTIQDMKEVFGKDAPDLATIGWLMANNADPMAMKDAIRGMDLRKSDGFVSRVPENKDTVRVASDVLIGSAFAAMPGADGYAIEVAKLIYEARAHDKMLDPKLKTLDPTLWNESLNEAFGRNKIGDVSYGGIGKVSTGWSSAPVFTIPSIRSEGGLQEIMSNLRMSDLVPMSPAKAMAAAAGREDATGRSRVFDSLSPDEAAKLPAEDGSGFIMAPEVGAQSVVVPGDGRGRPVPIAVIRSAVPVYAGNGKYFLRTGTDARGQPEFLKIAGAPDINYQLDVEALRPALLPRVAKGTYRPTDPTEVQRQVEDPSAKYRVRRPSVDDPTANSGLGSSFVPRFAPR